MLKTHALVIIVLLFTACSTEDITNEQIDKQITLVETETIKQSPLQQNIELSSGQIIPHTKIPLFTSLPLEVTDVHVNVGEKVQRGDILLTLNDEKIRYQVNQAREAVNELEKGLNEAIQFNQTIKNNVTDIKALEDDIRQSIEQSQALVQSFSSEEEIPLLNILQSSLEVSIKQAELTQKAGFLSQAIPINTFEIEAQLKNAKENLRQAEETLEATKLTAPITGVVAQLDAVQGQTILPNQPIVLIADLMQMNATFSVNNYQMMQLQQGMKAQINVPGLAEPVTGEIKTISPLVNPETNSFVVQIPLNNEDLVLKGGMRVTAQVHIEEVKDSLVIPTEALLFGEDGPYTFVVKGTQVRRQPVKLGVRNNNLHQVISGLNSGDLVVTTGKHRLVEGSEIKIRSE
ncbi:efflux RND transporter periplasmic adaptor subunit [Halalkalibacter urbisdiaboli]|uniref:efflux RND transporter periplasmic adaptor subunit n=1 Tax=Halalkalibacter urbisdiaboli TaxID=1960589 RepID=UPI0013FD9ED2|nr:efflux RND transporter periplasmic adaptor subunit [Halalkalibacter urbisdiaboli]